MSEVKNCPKCGGEMEKGYLNTARPPLFWDTKVHEGAFGRGSGEALIPFSWKVQSLQAYRCVKCKLVMFEYGKEEDKKQ